MMTNDELNKPRKFEIFYSGLAGTFSVRNNYSAFIMNIQKRQTDEYIHVIELAPMLKMMEEMIDTFDKFSKIRSLPLTDINDSDEEIANQYSSVIDGFIFRSKEIIESYQAFKRENGLE